MKAAYIFESERLGFREWKRSDIKKLARVNSNAKVMEFFPSIQDLQQTEELVLRMQKMFSERGYCYFPVERLEDRCFIGFIGIAYADFESEVTPCIDIGWRLDEQYWKKGYATEGAKRCLSFALEDLKIQKIKAIAPKVNLKSIQVMKKIGMKKSKEFKHPLLQGNKQLEECVCYEISRQDL